MKAFEVTARDANISADKVYRYSLIRRLGHDAVTRRICWAMLNPSTADAAQDDPTIRRVMDFSWMWGFNRVEIVNAYALRSTNPAHLWSHPDPTGPLNDDYIGLAAANADAVVVAWGTNITRPRAARVLQMLRMFSQERMLWCLGTTKEGYPRHPLYLAKSTQRITYPYVE